MAGLADLLYLGQPNPQMQLARALSGQNPPQQPTQPGPSGPSPPGGPAPDAPPSPGNPSPGTPPGPAVLQSSPDMAASYAQLASPQANDLMSLYLQMQQRAAASDQINRGFALIAANHAGNPAMAHAIMESASGGGGNVSGMFGDLMNIYGFQQKQRAMQSMLDQSPEIAQRLNMSEGVVRATILAGRGDELVQALEPTTTTRDIQAKHDMFIQSGGTEEDWKNNYLPFILSGGAGGGDAATRSWQTERIRWQQSNPGEPPPWGSDDPQSFALWKTQQEEMKKDQQEALDRRTTYVGNLTGLRNGLGDLVGLKPGDSLRYNEDGTLDTSNLDPAKLAALKGALSANMAQTYLSGDPKDLALQKLTDPFISPDQKKILDGIRTLTNPKALYGSISQHPTRRAQSDVTQIGTGLTDLTEIRSKSPDDWLSAAGGLFKTLDTATGNAFGASGEAEKAPDYTKEFIDPSYLKGGSQYPYGKKAMPMSQDQIAAATKEIQGAADKEGTRQKLMRIYLANNIDPTPLKTLRF